MQLTQSRAPADQYTTRPICWMRDIVQQRASKIGIPAKIVQR